MKKFGIVKIGVVFLALALAGCDETPVDNNADLAALRINGASVQLGAGASSPAGAAHGNAVQASGAGTAAITVNATAAASGADVKWGVTPADDADYNLEWGNRGTISFDSEGDYFLVVRVTSPDGSVIRYYKAMVTVTIGEQPPPPPPPVNAVKPVFTSHPAGAVYLLGETIAPLTAAAAASDGGTVTYEWFYAANWTETGSIEMDEIGQSYNPGILPTGTFYFYAVATNTNNAVAGTKKAAAASARARIEVFEAGKMLMERLTLRAGYAIYKFELPPGETWGSYGSITADYKLDADNAGKAGAIQLVGNYQESDFSPEGDQHMAAPLRILGAGTGAKIADEWFTVTYDISGGAHKPANGDTGPFYFGIGLPGDNAAITQLVKDVTLVHKTNVARNVVSKGSGLAAQAFAADPDGGLSQCSRRWVAEDPPIAPPEPVPDFIKDFTSNPRGNASAVSANNTGLVRVDLGEDFDITLYKRFTIELNVYGQDGTTPVSPANWNGILQMQWEYAEGKVCADRSGYPTNPGGGALYDHEWRWDLVNIGPGQAANTAADIPAYLFEIDESLGIRASPNPPPAELELGHPGSYLIEPLRYLYFKSAANWASSNARYLKVTKITFYDVEE